MLLELNELRKSYGSVEILHGIDLSVEEGEILGLVGENGAGKSTLMKCINGVTPWSDGKVFFGAKEIRQQNPAVAIASGIVTIPQEFNLVNHLTVAGNIFLGRELRNSLGLLRQSEMRRRSVELLEKLGADISPDELVENLSVPEKQMVEFAKALAFSCKLLIMDEPTTVLHRNEIEILFGVMRRLKEAGTSIIYISHKLKEVLTICDRVAVLRDGCLVSVSPKDELDEEELARRMVGRTPSQMFTEKAPLKKDAEIALQLENIQVPGVLHDVSFTLRKGEILGFAGLVGSGRTELAETIYGIRRTSGGTMTLFGKKVSFANPGQAIKAGVSYLAEDRQGTAVLTDFSVANNISLSSLKKYCRPFISGSKEKAAADSYIKAFNIKTQSSDTVLSDLSGGNQQKAAIAKGLDTNPRLFIFDEPTRGIDINAKSEVYAFINSLLAEGMTCILISSDLEEVMGLCRRIAVMREGTVAGFLEDEQISEEAVMFLASGVKTNSSNAI